jgi:cysteinyl-tRNA synthetase
MNDLYLTNTLTRKKERFKSLKPGRVLMFTCGPSIYAHPHVGNFATFLYEDILNRYLQYLGYDVTRVINFTDVEDKAIEESLERHQSFWSLVDSHADRFFELADILRLQLPPYIPRSSMSVDKVVELLQLLLKKGYAYRYEKDIYYDPLKFKGFGKLYGLDMRRWPKQKRRFSRDTYPGQRWNLGDFVLWHGVESEQTDMTTWGTPLGRGRPAWSIQDAAMILKNLGEQIDISCGGFDNLFRHHDYNIAIMEAATGKKFANYWLHRQPVLMDGKKMSKSAGNVIYVEDLIKQGFTPRQIRFAFIRGHYRQRLNFSWSRIKQTSVDLEEIRRTIRALCRPDPSVPRSVPAAKGHLEAITHEFEQHMNDDLNVGKAFQAIQHSVNQMARLKERHQLAPRETNQARKNLAAIDQVLRILDI